MTVALFNCALITDATILVATRIAAHPGVSI
jgi:hypothetical protein